MKHRWAAPVLVLAFCALVAGTLGGQGQGTPPARSQRIAGSLEQNTPNPFNPETTIGFHIGMEGDPPVCIDPNRQHRVSIRIYDQIQRLVAIPVLRGGGQALNNVVLRCGDYTAFWDGMRRGTSQKVASGIYLYVLDVDGRLAVKRMIVAK